MLIDTAILAETVADLEQRGHQVETATEGLTMFHFASPWQSASMMMG